MRKGKSTVVTVLVIVLLLLLSAGIFLFHSLKTDDQPTQNPESNTEGNSQPQMSDDDKSKRIAEIDAILSDPYMVLVNVDNGLTSDYEPQDLTTIQDKQLVKIAAEQLEKMLNDANEAGLDTINIYSAYRNYSRQETNYNNKVNYYLGEGYSEDRARELAAEVVNPPGKSEHQTGLATDICTAAIVNTYGNLNEAFEETEEYEWLYEHCAEYGFVLRYPKDKVEITGITFEPWHYRYVGVEAAQYIMEHGICYEEFYAHYHPGFKYG